jgi:UrcA family protein
MYKPKSSASGRSLAGAAVVVATLLGGHAVAKDHEVTVAIHVSTQGLDVGKPADAQIFYTRLKNAAWIVCNHTNRVGLVPSDSPRACYEKALGDAIGSVKLPVVTQLYLETHTPQEAATHGIAMPAQLAAK